MNIENYQYLSAEERIVIDTEEREVILAAGGRAKTVLLYLEDYFKKSEAAYHVAFRELPLDSELKEFQVVHQGLNALFNLARNIKGEITQAERVSTPDPVVTEDENLNI